MAQLFIKCPKTGMAISTGIDVSEDMDLSGFTDNKVSCPYCSTLHNWDGKDAFFKEE